MLPRLPKLDKNLRGWVQAVASSEAMSPEPQLAYLHVAITNLSLLPEESP